MLLLAPLLNHYLNDNNKRGYLICTLGMISLYFGTVNGDPSLEFGKNIIHFSFLYVIGNTIKQYNVRYSTGKLALGFIALNTILFALYLKVSDTVGADVVYKLFFFYCSPGLLINALLLFGIFNNLRFRSRIVNKIASATFSMYIIHHTPFVLFHIIGPISLTLLQSDSYTVTVFSLMCFTLFIMTVSFCVHIIASPAINAMTDIITTQMPKMDRAIKESNI